MIKDDCCMFDSRKVICKGLTLLECAFSDKCSFYKTEEQARAERKKCAERLERLGLTGKCTGPAKKENPETPDNA